MKVITYLAAFYIVLGTLSTFAEAREIKLIDDETGTQFSVTPLGGASPCDGFSGALTVIGEVPSNVSLEDDATAISLVEKGKEVALKACPRFEKNN